MKKYEKEWLKELDKIINLRIANVNFSTNELCIELRMSRSNLYRKMIELVDAPPKRYIRKKRLEKAKMLLESGRYYNSNDLLIKVGFKNKVSFNKFFFKEYQILPDKMLENGIVY